MKMDTKVGLQIIKKDSWIPVELQNKMLSWNPKSRLGQIIRDCFSYLPKELAEELFDRVCSSVVTESSLGLLVIRVDGRRENLGVVGYKVVTDAGVGYLAGCFTNANEAENMKYHGIGTGTTAEAAGDTALVTELTTQYNPDNTRATGSASLPSANVYQSVGTNTVDSAVAITEHGIFSSATSGAGTLWDRTKFSAINLASGDSLQSTYQLTINSGG